MRTFSVRLKMVDLAWISPGEKGKRSISQLKSTI